MTQTQMQFPCSADPDRMFPTDEVETGPPSAGEWSALALCARCPSLAPCRSWALTSGIAYGVVGGTTRAQRRGRAVPSELARRRTSLQDVLARQRSVAREADTFVVEELIAGTRGLPASRWEVALAAVVLIELGRPKLQICRDLGVHPRQLYRWWTRYRAFQPVVPVAAAGASAGRTG